MNGSKNWLVLLIASATAGCGQQLVQFGAGDQATPIDATADSARADMSTASDQSENLDLIAVADLAMPDLLMSDLSMSDLSMPDLSMSDLVVADLVLPDASMRDLRLSDQLMPDQSLPDQSLPDQSLPDQSLPDQSRPDQFADMAPISPGPLRSLETYAIVAASTITNTGATTIIGSIGLSPGPKITGIPMGMPINGSIHVADGPAAQAQMGLTFAYDFMAAKPCGTNLTGKDLGGLTLAPGVYCFNISAAMAIGSTLILDAKNDPNATWTFQIASTLILGDFSKIHVINGGRDCSVNWQVGSSATLGTGAILAGNLLAQASITLNKGAGAGRALARTGGVTMDTNVVAIGPCH